MHTTGGAQGGRLTVTEYRQAYEELSRQINALDESELDNPSEEESSMICARHYAFVRLHALRMYGQEGWKLSDLVRSTDAGWAQQGREYEDLLEAFIDDDDSACSDASTPEASSATTSIDGDADSSDEDTTSSANLDAPELAHAPQRYTGGTPARLGALLRFEQQQRVRRYIELLESVATQCEIWQASFAAAQQPQPATKPKVQPTWEQLLGHFVHSRGNEKDKAFLELVANVARRSMTVEPKIPIKIRRAVQSQASYRALDPRDVARVA
ncbi:hypothetical protein EXIGLDRAFT_830333 [Exidia glandulosa HHB12029]|uniref:Uncharacterized protein n=1 Tax=Exidia glandulosa HHB12029 TaxID=1314781 RepID=A0A165NKP6_EXIGL|nr:hypothetical protein EXIGLDRAFT_830333 [Exidia glandulosa HHB12029]